MRMFRSFRTLSLGLVASVAWLAGCSAADQILDVRPPVGLSTIDNVKTQSGAEAFYASAAALFEQNLTSQSAAVGWSEVMTDQFQPTTAYPNSVDARRTAYTSTVDNNNEFGNTAYGSLLYARSLLLLSVEVLSQYEPPSGRSKIGQAYAKAGYLEVMLAEMFCSGVTLDRIVLGGGVEYAHPITVDSLFAVATTHFDSALVYAGGDASVEAFANVGKARALLGRGNYAGAATAAQRVPTSFVLNLNTEYANTSGSYSALLTGSLDYQCYNYSISDREGGTGIDYVSAHDPRLVTTDTLCTDGFQYSFHRISSRRYGYPILQMPLASGIEARLIEAESKLSTNDASWIDDLNALRTTCTDASTCATNAPPGAGGVTGLPPLSVPDNADSSMALVFRERAFWLFAQGSRLGDMRRLVKYHHRPSNTVYPTGAYPLAVHTAVGITPMTTYGDDISFTLPTQAAIDAGTVLVTNPYYKGCLGSTTAD